MHPPPLRRAGHFDFAQGRLARRSLSTAWLITRSVADQCRLARHALPFAILLNPDIGKTAGTGNNLSFLSYIILIYPGSNGDISVQVNRHPTVSELLIMIDSVSDMSQPLALVHKMSVIVCECKCLRKQQTQGPRIMFDFGLVPGVLERQNSRGFIPSHILALGSDWQTNRHQ